MFTYSVPNMDGQKKLKNKYKNKQHTNIDKRRQN